MYRKQSSDGETEQFLQLVSNAAAWYGTTAGDAAATVVTTTTPPVADPVFGGVIYQKATGGVV